MNYFLQTPEWMNFWIGYNKLNHRVHHFQEGSLLCYIQEYPWQLGTKFWYIPKAPVFTEQKSRLNQETILQDLDNLYSKITKQAKENGIIFIKNDFDDTLTNQLGIENDQDLIQSLGELKSLSNLKLVPNTKKIQYLECTYCDISYLPKASPDQNLQEFWDDNQSFWAKCNEQVRRYTRKSLKDYNQGLYTINTEKTTENFEAFWSVHRDTTLRQNFSTQPKDYLINFMNSDFGRIITVRDQSGVPMSVWLGVKIENTLYYILGGNSDIALKSRTQYLLQLAAVQLAKQEGCDYYDMGGYEAGSGYGQFKDGYKGIHREFLGPVDIVLDPIKYKAINLISSTAKSIKNLIKP